MALCAKAQALAVKGRVCETGVWIDPCARLFLASLQPMCPIISVFVQAAEDCPLDSHRMTEIAHPGKDRCSEAHLMLKKGQQCMKSQAMMCTLTWQTIRFVENKPLTKNALAYQHHAKYRFFPCVPELPHSQKFTFAAAGCVQIE